MPPAPMRARRLSLPDRNFAYDGGGGCGAAAVMTTFFLTAGVPPRDRLEQAGLWSLIGIVAAMQLSIAAAQILLALASLAWLISHISRGERLEAPQFFWPLLAYAAL